jgi:FkbM family methyltransferase
MVTMNDRTETLRLPMGLDVEQLCVENTMIAYREIFVDRIYGPSVADLADGDVVLDVGANIGLFTLYLNTLAKRLTVHCFEPIPQTFKALQMNMASHDRLAATLHNVGAANRDGVAEFTFYPKTSTSSSMYPDETQEAHDESNAYITSEIHRLSWGLTRFLPSRLMKSWAESVRRDFQRAVRVPCRLVRLSDVIRSAGLTRVDLLKVDVEGAEFDCIEGIDAEHWPLVRRAIVEVHGGATDRDRMERMLIDRGLSINRTFQQSPEIFSRHYLIEASRDAKSRIPAVHTSTTEALT